VAAAAGLVATAVRSNIPTRVETAIVKDRPFGLDLRVEMLVKSRVIQQSVARRTAS
jgi:hypothetical protein